MSKNGYRSYNAIITPLPKNVKRRSYLYRRAWKIVDPFNPKHFTRLIISVPIPDKKGDEPCILVALRQSHTSLFMRFRSLGELFAWFNLSFDMSDEEKEFIDRCLWVAFKIAYHRDIAEDNLQKLIMELISPPKCK